MIIDANGYLGRWGLRTHGIAEAGVFIREMDRCGIGVAAVTSTVALVTDTREGNAWLLNAVESHRDRLIPVACLNPVWGIEEAREYSDRGFKIARISPALHNYSLSDTELLGPFTDHFLRARIPVWVTADVCYDFGGMAGVMGFSPPVCPVAEIAAFARRNPLLKVVICGYDCQLSGEVDRVLVPALKRNPNLFVETSNILVPGAIERLAGAAPGQVLLGTGSGVNYASGAIVKIDLAGIGAREKTKIMSANAGQVLPT